MGISEATMMLHTIAQYVHTLLFLLLLLKSADIEQHDRSGAGLAGAQSIHANVYATQVSWERAY